MKEQKTLNKPTFRGRFGTRSKRKKSIAKWDKWRHPQGIDISWKAGDGSRPKIGYSAKKEIRGLHPKGKEEKYIRCMSDVERVSLKDAKEYVFRLASKLGQKKREEIVEACTKKKMVVLNK